jgi:arylsulfatase
MPQKVQEIPKKPNILLIMGDDIGWSNVSAYNHGIMGYKTSNGLLFRWILSRVRM